MDASQYKDYVLTMLFIKYMFNKYGAPDAFASPITIPEGASFADIVGLEGHPDTGNKIHSAPCGPQSQAGAERLSGLSR